MQFCIALTSATGREIQLIPLIPLRNSFNRSTVLAHDKELVLKPFRFQASFHWAPSLGSFGKLWNTTSSRPPVFVQPYIGQDDVMVHSWWLPSECTPFWRKKSTRKPHKTIKINNDYIKCLLNWEPHSERLGNSTAAEHIAVVFRI